jgi:hypothetical protein
MQVTNIQNKYPYKHTQNNIQKKIIQLIITNQMLLIE